MGYGVLHILKWKTRLFPYLDKGKVVPVLNSLTIILWGHKGKWGYRAIHRRLGEPEGCSGTNSKEKPLLHLTGILSLIKGKDVGPFLYSHINDCKCSKLLTYSTQTVSLLYITNS
jgi:hypothetical protein